VDVVPHDVGHGHSGLGQHGLDVVHRLGDLLLHVAVVDRVAVRVDRTLAGDVDDGRASRTSTPWATPKASCQVQGASVVRVMMVHLRRYAWVSVMRQENPAAVTGR
jgi:hypothetical protein